MSKLKDVVWLGDSRDIIGSFSLDVRQDLGADLWRLQSGVDPLNWKPFPGLKKNAFELRTRDVAGIYRVIYATFVKDKIYVLHCFQKKSSKTSQLDIDKANKRLSEITS